MNRQTDGPQRCPGLAPSPLLSACPVALPLWSYSPNCSEPCRDGELRAGLGAALEAAEPVQTLLSLPQLQF